jgi:hypothetical protein
VWLLPIDTLSAVRFDPIFIHHFHIHMIYLQRTWDCALLSPAGIQDDEFHVPYLIPTAQPTRQVRQLPHLVRASVIALLCYGVLFLSNLHPFSIFYLWLRSSNTDYSFSAELKFGDWLASCLPQLNFCRLSYCVLCWGGKSLLRSHIVSVSPSTLASLSSTCSLAYLESP